ncbi:MAG: hypothetical protein P8H34_08110 [Flavobacteriaceae bacterium]|nr:hypothetical protein [Flavobacteriaceae bacterium]
MKYLNPPINHKLPFLAYGSFKPGELRFNLIKQFVVETKPTKVYGLMKEKDGVPIFYTTKTKSYAWFDYAAYEIHFKKGHEQQAYQIITENEPNSYYTWVNFQGANILEGKSRLRGLEEFMDETWSFKHDPYFSQGLLACKEIRKGSRSKMPELHQEYFDFFCNQSAFMLLWTIIERFCTLKYGNLSPNEKLKSLYTDPEIEWDFVYDVVKRNDSIVRSDKEKEQLKLNSASSIKKILEYYYGLRSNMVHRGKNVFGDINRISDAFDELYQLVEVIIKIHWGEKL